MSETKTSAQKQHSALLAAPCTRKVLEEMLGSARFQDAIENIVQGHGKHDALEAVNDITTYLGQAHIETELPPLTTDHFWLLQLFYELIRSMPDGDELREAQVNDMALRQK